jgi:hypothetical protein
MAISEAFTGTETVSSTEWSLTGDDSSLDTITTDGVYQVWLDLSALAAGDIFELKAYEKVLSGGTQRLCYLATFAGVQGEPHWVGPSFIFLHGWDLSLKKLSGTDRAISWSIRSIA